MHPDPNTTFPLPGSDRVCFLKNIVTNPNIIVGDYTYYDDPVDVHRFNDNVLYHFDFIGDKLIIGKFCQIASNVTFIMNGANHDLSGFSSFPFVMLKSYWPEIPFSPTSKGNTIIGNDVWIGYGAVIMPGVTIGDGAIIGTHAMVTKDVAPYSIVAGNPATEIRKRFDDATIAFLCQLNWWDWPIETIRANVQHIMNADQTALSALT